MSWNIGTVRGTPAEVRDKVTKMLTSVKESYEESAAHATSDAARKSYTREAKDVEYALASIQDAIDDFQAGVVVDDRHLDGVSVEAWGSRSTGYAYANSKFEVKQVTLE